MVRNSGPDKTINRVEAEFPCLSGHHIVAVMQELGPWCAAMVLHELIKPRHANRLLEQYSDMGANVRNSARQPFADAMRKTPGSYIPTSKLTRAVDSVTNTVEVMLLLSVELRHQSCTVVGCARPCAALCCASLWIWSPNSYIWS